MKFKNPILLLFFVLLPVFLSAQNSDTDSLEVQLSGAEGRERIPLLIQLAKSLSSNLPKEALGYAVEALELLRRYSDLQLEAEVYYWAGWSHIYLREFSSATYYSSKVDSLGEVLQRGDIRARAYLLNGRTARQQGLYDKAIAFADSGLVLLEQNSEEELRLQLLNELGSVYRRKGENKQALDYHNEALVIARRLDDKVSISTTLGYLGIVYDIMGNYDEALRAHQETLKLRRELDDRRGVGAALTNIGILHQKIDNYAESMRFYRQALEIWEELGRQAELAATYNNMGAVEELRENYDPALSFYQKALSIWQDQENTQSMAIALSNIANINRELGNYEEALMMAERAYQIRNEAGDIFGSATSLIDIAELHEEMGQANQALEVAHQALTLAEQTQSWPLIRDSHHMLSILYKNREQFEQALEHYSSYKSAHDSVFNIESRSVIAELQEAYNTQEQQQQIAILQQREKMNNIWVAALGGGIIAITVVMGLVYSRYRMKKRTHDALEQLHAKEIVQAKLVMEKAEATARYLKAENERKSQELEAARELQLSMLPLEIPEIPNVEIAAIMKTAAEVGGDYYDFHLADDGTLTVVLGDATGHGVKAGTMVTATKSLFNLLAEKDLVEMLELSSAAITKMKLHKMYMALALLRLRNRSLHLAGAGMPSAHIFRAKTGQIETKELKGMPLGSSAVYPYRQQTIDLEPGDTVLIFTDGLPELFNPEGDMLGYDAIPELLAGIHHGSAQEIVDHLSASANRWVGDGVPDDDMTIIALKLDG